MRMAQNEKNMKRKNREMKSIIYKNKEFTHTKKRRGRKKTILIKYMR